MHKILDYLLLPYYFVAVCIDEFKASRREHQKKGHDRWGI